MIESIFALLMASPVLSISLGFALAVILAILFRKVIESYLIKKFGLYNTNEVKEAIKNTLPAPDLTDEGKISVKSSLENINNETFIDIVISKLDNKYRARNHNPIFRAQLETYKYYQKKLDTEV